MQLSSNRVLFATARVLEIIVGLVFLLAAFMKALDPQSFQQQIASFGIFPSLSMVAAWTFIIVEVALAAGLIVNFYPRIVPILTIAMLIFFIGITLYGMAVGLGESCGCFGNLVHRGPEQVIIEDALMIIALIFASVVIWSRQSTLQPWRIAVVVAAAAIAGSVTAFSPYLPVDDFVTQLRPGAHFTAWPVDGLYGKDLNKGTHVVFLFTVESDKIGLEVEKMSEIAQQEKVKSAVGLIIDGTEHLTTLMFEYAASFPVAAIEPRFARPLYRALPRVFILRNGVVTHTWSELPNPAVVVQALQSAAQ
ncbi:MAG: MauE/DoxX family redox-associated membrane protein [Bacteroidota bacterium]